jgi:hypothetical protein
MNDWLDNFTMMGIPLNEGEKSLMRYAMKKKQDEIIKLLENSMAECSENKKPEGCDACYGQRDAISIIRGENG